MLRYHEKINFPKEDIKKLQKFNDNMNIKSFSFSSHCLENIKYRAIDLTKVLEYIKNDVEFNKEDIFEYYKDNIEEIEKACYRIEYDNKNDLILVMGKDKKIITIYFNEKEDNHETLKKELYNK